jgi:hypothetical protein
MGDDHGQRAREWLERQIAELAELRNATRRDPKFKQWRQQTVTVLQRIWPGDKRRVDRFQRIPFSPPMGHPTDHEVREHYERGWGEAGVLLRNMLAEVKEKGVTMTEPGEAAGPASLPRPALERAKDEPAPEQEMPAAPAPAPTPARDDIGRAMDRLMSHSPVFKVQKASAPRSTGNNRFGAASTPGELVTIAGELGALGVPPGQRDEVRRALVALDRAVRSNEPTWELLREALHHAGTTPGLARRMLPLLLPLIEKAA